MPESNNKSNWDPDNPHPLAKMKTELVWEGKYDEYGNRRPVKLPASALPLQRIETIDEPRDREKAAQGSLFDHAEFSAKTHRACPAAGQGRFPQHADLGRQQACHGLAARTLSRQDRSDLHRPAVRRVFKTSEPYSFVWIMRSKAARAWPACGRRWQMYLPMPA